MVEQWRRARRPPRAKFPSIGARKARPCRRRTTHPEFGTFGVTDQPISQLAVTMIRDHRARLTTVMNRIA